jgi:hypothetical protein
MLFQAYTSGRLAEFVHLSKGKSSKDPLGKREETSKSAYPRKVVHCDYDDTSDADNEPECDDNNDASDDARSDNDVLFDFEDDESDAGTVNEDMDGPVYLNSGYNNDGIDVTMIEDIDKCYMTELDECK